MAAGVTPPSRPAHPSLHNPLPLSHTNKISNSSSSSYSSFITNNNESSTTSSSSSSSTFRLRSRTLATTSSPATSSSSSSSLIPIDRSSSPYDSSSSVPHHRYRQHQQHQHQPQLGATSPKGESKTQKPGGLFAFAAAAIDRTQSAIATISDSTVRHQRSLSRLSSTGDASSHSSIPSAESSSPDKTSRYRPSSTLSNSSSSTLLSPQLPGQRFSSQTSLVQEPQFSQPYSKTDPNQPPPVLLPRVDNKMHQTSSRLLRMTDDDRPFTKVRPTQPQLSFVLFRPRIVPQGPMGSRQPWAHGTRTVSYFFYSCIFILLLVLTWHAGLQRSLLNIDR